MQRHEVLVGDGKDPTIGPSKLATACTSIMSCGSANYPAIKKQLSLAGAKTEPQDLQEKLDNPRSHLLKKAKRAVFPPKGDKADTYRVVVPVASKVNDALRKWHQPSVREHTQGFVRATKQFEGHILILPDLQGGRQRILAFSFFNLRAN